MMGLAAAFVGGSGAWQGFETTCRATSAAKVPQMWRAPEGRRPRARQAAPLIDARIQAEGPASSVARWTPPRPASWAAWVRHENPSARYTASGCADRDGSRECDATATDRS